MIRSVARDHEVGSVGDGMTRRQQVQLLVVGILLLAVVLALVLLLLTPRPAG